MVLLRNIYLLNRQVSNISDGNGAYDNITWIPFADVFESRTRYYVVLELPGITEDQIHAETEGNRLKIRGYRKTKREGYRYHQIERGFGGFIRHFEFPEVIDPDGVEAVLKDGVLKIQITKSVSEDKL